jgi:hypothetical protein
MRDMCEFDVSNAELAKLASVGKFVASLPELSILFTPSSPEITCSVTCAEFQTRVSRRQRSSVLGCSDEARGLEEVVAAVPAAPPSSTIAEWVQS